jgi:uncharacterized repeat protein (TIGR03803 family)
LILSGNTVYGTASGGGANGNGTVFAVNTNGAGFTNLYTFTAPYFVAEATNSDGANPQAGLILSGDTLYGTATSGGANGNGTVFAVNTNGAGFTVLHAFIGGADGAFPQAGLILSGNTLYGTAEYGGSGLDGTVFAVNTNGAGFTVLHDFIGGADGAYPQAGLILSGNTLYGTTRQGGISGNGTVFSLLLNAAPSAPQLTIIHSGASVILTWPTNFTGFTLQSTTNLAPSAIWTTVSPGPGVENTNNAVTNSISGEQQYYWLSQ